MSATSVVTWWLNVTEKGRFGKGGLYFRKVEMGFLPEPGDNVLYLASEEEEDGAIDGTVKSRYWDVFGNAHITFQQIIIDPADYMPETPHRTETYWWTDRDGDPYPYLKRSGWRKH